MPTITLITVFHATHIFSGFNLFTSFDFKENLNMSDTVFKPSNDILPSYYWSPRGSLADITQSPRCHYPVFNFNLKCLRASCILIYALSSLKRGWGWGESGLPSLIVTMYTRSSMGVRFLFSKLDFLFCVNPVFISLTCPRGETSKLHNNWQRNGKMTRTT